MRGNPQDQLDDPVKYSCYSYKCGEWYSERTKDYLSTVLDAYDSYDESPIAILMPYNMYQLHWIHFRCSIGRRKLGTVESVNYMKSTMFKDLEMKHHRMLFAKFMGMYMEEKHNVTLKYCGPSDMHLSPGPEQFDEDNERNISLHHDEDRSEKLQQTDGHNCMGYSLDYLF